MIIGSGPVGLYWAGKLALLKKNTGIPLNVVVIDPRAGNYKRERIVSNEVIKTLASEFSLTFPPAKGIPPEAMYIKDFETTLYNYCSKMGVIFKKGNFDELNNMSVSYKDDENNLYQLKCDLVIDCSGANRKVLLEANRKLDKDIFEIKPIGKNPHPNHFFCYMSLSAEEALKLLSPEKEISPVIQAVELSKLRQKYGWPDYSFPSLDIRSAENESHGFNYFIYYEVPDDLKEDKELQISFLKELLRLRYGFESEINLKIKSIGHFPVSPHYVAKPFYISDVLPAIVPGGDCQIEPDYRLGIGIESGLTRANYLLDTATVKNKEIQFSFENYYQKVAQYMNYHGNLLEKFYKRREDSINNSLEKAKKIFCAAAELNGEKKDKDSFAISQELKILGNEFFKKSSYQNALNCYQSSINLRQNMAESIPLTMDFITLISNACQVYLKLKDYENGLNMANFGIQTYLDIKGDDQGVFFKLLFRKAAILCEIINGSDVNKKENLDELMKTHDLMRNNENQDNSIFVVQIDCKIEKIKKDFYGNINIFIQP